MFLTQYILSSAGLLYLVFPPIIQLHSEAGKGQFEIVLGYTDCRRAANNLIITHELIRGIARKHGLLASFMPRYYPGLVDPHWENWMADYAGSGSHVHISLSKNGENVFMASGEPTRYGMSNIGEFFMAGVLDHLGSMCVYTMPLENSYERGIYKKRNSYYKCWGVECKELTVRACRPPGAADGISTNFEVKTFDGAANPHLGLACIIMAGIDGLERNLPIPEPVDPVAYDIFDYNNIDSDYHLTVPHSLRSANMNMHLDQFFKDILGENFVETREGVLGEELSHWFDAREEKYVHMVFNY